MKRMLVAAPTTAEWPNQQVRDELLASASPNKVENAGKGSPNLLLFLGGCSGSSGSSPITTDSCNRQAASDASVEVRITHPRRGALKIELLAPDGSAYLLKKANLFDSRADVAATYHVDLSAEFATGTWTLKVTDTLGFVSSGTLRWWSIVV